MNARRVFYLLIVALLLAVLAENVAALDWWRTAGAAFVLACWLTLRHDWIDGGLR